jgi:hypothetical protein
MAAQQNSQRGEGQPIPPEVPEQTMSKFERTRANTSSERSKSLHEKLEAGFKDVTSEKSGETFAIVCPPFRKGK